MSFAPIIAAKLGLRVTQVETVLDLLAESATIPFNARYRKDSTGNLDEVQIQQIQDEQKTILAFTERKTFIEKTITDQGKMTEGLQAKINAATTIVELEDIYLPYKVKRKTKAVVARENGLEPLANFLLEQGQEDPEKEATKFFNEKITTIEEALQGARDIIAEQVNEQAEIRAQLRKLFEDTATLQSKVLSDKEAEAIKYKDYFDFSEPIHKIPSHRILAILRGFLEGFLRMTIAPVEEDAIESIEAFFIKGMSPSSNHIKKAIKDAYRRLLQPSLETECRTALKQKADEEAINVFAENLRQLLLSAPLGSKRVLAIDPGYRTGCKVVCLDESGELLTTDLIYVHEANKIYDSEYKIKQLVKQFDIQVFAIGDGTAGRETEQFIKKLNLGLPVFLVNEDGASVYSASEIAREEFPDYDITVRGSVSIGRRLMDPLAELVKIDPKSIGVGQYQHDVNQFRLKEKLDQTVVSCVNTVGVNLNTASKQLLSYVSGINESVAENIIKQIKKPGLDPRSELEQFEFANIYSMEEVTVGLVLPGVVTNLTRFGAFIDIGVKQDGLVHVSEIANRYISDPSEALKLGQKVQVKVLEVDLSRKRIALSIKQTEAAPAAGVGGRKDFNQHKRSNQPVKKEEDLSNLNVTDALQALKKKF